MPRTSDFIAAASSALEIMIFPASNFGPMDVTQGFTDTGREQVDRFLATFDEAAFNAGFNSAVEAILGPKGMTNVHFDHPQFLTDRSAAYRKAREGAGV